MKEININIEGYNVNGICVGCLNYNRKMFYCEKIKECFKLLGDIDVPDGLAVQVCWECLAAVLAALRFRTQILNSYSILIEYSSQHTFLNSPSDLSVHAARRLRATEPELEQIGGEQKPAFEVDVSVIKEETKEEVQEFAESELVKSESEYFDNADNSQEPELTSEDDIQLSKLQKKKEKRAKKTRKKRREDKERMTEIKPEKYLERSSRKLKNLPPDLVELFVMTEEEMWQIRAEDVNSKEFCALKYRCSDCIIGFNSEKLMNDHMQGKHVPKSPDCEQCDVCRAYFLTRDNVAKHRALHRTAYRCGGCGLRSALKRRMLGHARRHRAAAAQCATCGEHFSTKSKLAYHKNVCNQAKPRCDCCGKLFANKMTLKYHLKFPHDKQLKRRHFTIKAIHGQLVDDNDAQDTDKSACAEKNTPNTTIINESITHNTTMRTQHVPEHATTETFDVPDHTTGVITGDNTLALTRHVPEPTTVEIMTYDDTQAQHIPEHSTREIMTEVNTTAQRRHVPEIMTDDNSLAQTQHVSEHTASKMVVDDNTIVQTHYSTIEMATEANTVALTQCQPGHNTIEIMASGTLAQTQPVPKHITGKIISGNNTLGEMQYVPEHTTSGLRTDYNKLAQTQHVSKNTTADTICGEKIQPQMQHVSKPTTAIMIGDNTLVQTQHVPEHTTAETITGDEILPQQHVSKPTTTGTITGDQRLPQMRHVPEYTTDVVKIERDCAEERYDGHCATVADEAMVRDAEVAKLTEENKALAAENWRLKEELQRFCNFETEINQRFLTIQAQLDTIIDFVKAKHCAGAVEDDRQTDESGSLHEGLNIHFPMDTKEELDMLEHKLMEKTFEKQLVNRFSKICGTSGISKAGKVALPLLKFVITDELFNKCTWKGIKGCNKIPFLNYTRVREFIFQVLHLADSSCSIHDSDQLLQNSAIKHSGQRIKRKLVLPQNKEEKPKEKLYISCKGCNKVFHSKKSYRAHVVIHDGLTYPCPICGKLFQWKRNLARHTRNHRDRDAGATHECRECGKMFSSRDCYNNHMKLSKRHVHEDAYVHACSYCGKKFATKWCMVDHVDWDHLKRVKYQCSVCFKAFKTAKIMVAHMNNIHEGKKHREPDGEHLCEICGKSYKTVKRLKGHVWAMHTNRSSSKSFKCKLCPATFTWQTSIYKHTKTMHDAKRTKQLGPLPVSKQEPYPEPALYYPPAAGLDPRARAQDIA